MSCEKWDGLVLSIYLTARGFAYAVFEAPLSPIDWGAKTLVGPRKNPRCLERILSLVEQYQPDTLVIQECSEKDSERSARIRRLYRTTEALARSHTIDVHRYSRSQIRQCFAKLGATTKYEIAHAISKLIPAFAHRLPPVRRTWMSEDPRMSLFDAASLTFTFFCFNPRSR
jgi:hypothetical protein